MVAPSLHQPTSQLLAADSASNIAEKAEVKEYFDDVGFERWNKIYSDSDDINTVQQDIRSGHDVTIDKVLEWTSGQVSGKSICDLGCGVGSLAIPLAKSGANVAASDISDSMSQEAARRACS